MTVKDNKRSKYLLAGWFCMLFALAATSCKDTTTSRSLSEREFHYEERLSALSKDKSGYWIGSETGIVWHVEGQDRKRYYTGLDRIYDIERDPVHTDRIWIAARNEGLQRWHLAGDTLIHEATFDIPFKGKRYSPYDIDIVDGSLLAATSQGLFSMPLKGQQPSLEAVYPSVSVCDSMAGKPFLVNQLAHGGKKQVFAATQGGLACINLHSGQTELRHKGENIRSVAVYDGKLYILSGSQLTIEQPDGHDSKVHPLPHPVLSFYKAGTTLCFITASSILLSDNMERFVSIPLRNNIPDNPHKIAIPDDGNGFSVLLTKNAVWRIPHHLGFFNANPSVVAACPSGSSFFYVNNQHELFRQDDGEKTAARIYDFENDELPKEMYAQGNDIYYYNGNNQLCRLTVGRHYLTNQLFARPQVLAQPKTRITSMALQPSRNRILLGVQDYLLSINLKTSRVDTVSAMNSKYATSFHQAQNSKETYIATLNHGVFVEDSKQILPVAGTQDKIFISSLLTYGKPRPRLLLLTNHHLMIPGSDSLRADGCSSMFCINDSVVYTVPESGIHKYKIRNGRLMDCGSLFADIHFNAQTGFVHGNSLHIGSDLGVLQLEPGKEAAARWLTFDDNVPSLELTGIVICTVICVICVVFLSYRRNLTLTYRQLQMNKDDLHRRLAALDTLKNRLTETERNAIDSICNEIDSIDISSQSLHENNEQFKKLSARIARLNRDAALQMVKYLDEQVERMRLLDAYERDSMIHDSEEARSTDRIEVITEQCRRNEMWLNHIQELQERLEKFHSSTQGTLVLKGLNEGMEQRIHHIREKYRLCPVDEIYADFNTVKSQYERIFSAEGLDIIRSYISGSISRLKHQEGYGLMVKALLDELQTMEKDVCNRDRIVLLRLLQTVSDRIAQVKQLTTLQRLMQEYASVYDSVIQENEERRMKKFNSKLFADIESATRDITDRMADVSEAFFRRFAATDKEICEGVFHFTTAGSQQVRVLILLLAMPRVKRTLLPGMLGIYGNLNPVVSRLYHGKIGDNKAVLTDYCRKNQASIVQYILKLSE